MFGDGVGVIIRGDPTQAILLRQDGTADVNDAMSDMGLSDVSTLCLGEACREVYRFFAIWPVALPSSKGVAVNHPLNHE